MDPITIFAVGTLMMLANGGVLGLMHRDIPPTMQAAAASWRIATLLIAGGCVLFMVQQYWPPGFILPLSNGLVMLGFAGYCHALRQFYGLTVAHWLLLPVIIGVVGVFWFAQIETNIVARILVVSVVWITIMIACISVLAAQRHHETAISRRVLSGIFTVIIIFSLVRVTYFVVLGFSPGQSVLDASSWMNIATPMIAAVLPVIGTTAFLLMCSERIRRQWEQAASTDYLTGLPNRRTLADVGAKRYLEFRHQGRSLALAVIDVDHFKSLNDRFGHDVGDLALKHVAARLKSACRSPDLPARQGGEEFVVLFEGIDAEQAHVVGERMRNAVATHAFTHNGNQLTITVSIGIALLQQQDASFDALMTRADVALYAAKANGRNRVEIATTTLSPG